MSATSLSNLVIVSRTELTFATSTLPAGPETLDFVVQCTLLVSDSLDAQSTAGRPVRVNAVSAAKKEEALLRALQSTSESVDEVKSTLSVVSSALNSVNCTAATGCSTLHRSECQRTSGSCGPCLPGYFGDVGDRNTLCIKATQALNSSAAPTSCTSDAECLSWQTCNRLSGYCTARPKTCDRNCSTHGECVFVSQLTGGVVDNCPLDNVKCDAVCACVDGYSGVFC